MFGNFFGVQQLRFPKRKRWTPELIQSGSIGLLNLSKAEALDSYKRPKLKRWTPEFIQS
ncbi:MAG: hypothetical protein KAI83_15775 [Thiomargarita sp.]|nr:hypothetical protein [Thiomargarita sp.]